MRYLTKCCNAHAYSSRRGFVCFICRKLVGIFDLIVTEETKDEEDRHHNDMAEIA